jgi:cystathionine beta-lyase
MADDKRTDAASTRQVHHDYAAPSGFAAVAPAVHRASTVLFDNVAAMRASHWLDKSTYTYGLHGTPTSFTLEARLATLEGGTHAILVPSGLAAIALVDQSVLSSGDTVLIPANVYFPNRNLAVHELARWGIAHRFYDPMDADSLRAALGDDVALVWIEPPGSITLEFPDLRALLRTVRAHAPRALVAIDNTWGSGLAFDAFDLEPGATPALGADLTIHALTKYPSGGADLLMGSITTRDEELHQRLKMTHMRMGWGVGANDVESVLRSLPSIAIRYDAQDAGGRAIAQWCARRTEIARVLHPALAGSPGHEHWARLCTRAAGLFSVVFDARYERARVDAFVDALRLFRIGYSWAGPMSLAVPYEIAAIRKPAPWPGMLVRFSIGLEAVDDLIADIEQALAVLRD